MKLFKKRRQLPTWLMWLAYGFVKLLAWTYRVEIDDPGNWLGDEGRTPVVVALWHNRILFVSALFKRSLLERFSVLISKSRDGEYVTKFISYFGIHVVRGSSSKGGVTALLGLVDELKQGRSVILAVDGPRGPKYTVHPGVTLLAEQCDVPVVTVAINASSYWQLKSWDNTQIPKPFAKLTIAFNLPEKLTAQGRDAQCEEIRQRLMRLTVDRT